MPPHWMVCAELSSRTTVIGRDGKGKVFSRQRRASRGYPLTGTASCGHDGCGHSLVGNFMVTGKWSARMYACHGCGRIGVKAEPVENKVRRELIAELRRRRVQDTLKVDEHRPRRDAIDAELQDIEVQRKELGRMWARRKIDPLGWQAAIEALDEDQVRLERELAAIPPPIEDVDPDALDEAWDAMTVDEVRHMVRLFVEAVVVVPAGAGLRPEDRATIVWRERLAAA